MKPSSDITNEYAVDMHISSKRPLSVATKQPNNLIEYIKSLRDL